MKKLNYKHWVMFSFPAKLIYFLLRIIEKIFSFFIILCKYTIRRFCMIDSWCKKCGVNIKDFQVRDDDWNKAIGETKYKNKCVCYNCYCDLTNNLYHLGNKID